VKTPTKCNSVSKFLLSLILNKTQHVLGDTPPIIRILKLYKQPLVFIRGRLSDVQFLDVRYATWQRPTTARPTTLHVCKTRGCFCSFRLLMLGGVSPETCWASFKTRNYKNFVTLLHLVGFFTVRIVLWCTDPRSSNIFYCSAHICPFIFKWALATHVFDYHSDKFIIIHYQCSGIFLMK
jgi:hypothetical protein